MRVRVRVRVRVSVFDQAAVDRCARLGAGLAAGTWMTSALYHWLCAASSHLVSVKGRVRVRVRARVRVNLARHRAEAHEPDVEHLIRMVRVRVRDRVRVSLRHL